MYKLKEPVRIRFKELKDGNKSIYLDIYMKGRKREYIFLNLYLHPEQSKEDKEWNCQQLQLANAIKARHIIQIQNDTYGFKNKANGMDRNFIDYCKDIVYEYKRNDQRSCAVLLEYAIKRLVRYKGADITFRQIDKEFLVGFIKFLNKDTRDFDKDTDERMARPISSGY